MSSPYLLVAFAFVVYALAVDEYVAPYLTLQSKRLGLFAQRAYWMVRMHPRAPWTRYEINRRAWRIAKEIQDSFNLPDTEDRK